VTAAGDDSGSDKEIVKEWRTRSRGIEKGMIMFFFTCFLFSELNTYFLSNSVVLF